MSIQKVDNLPEHFNAEQVDLIKKTVAVGATDTELQMFLYQAERTGLDPLSRQIHFVKRQGKGTIQTGIDGFRLIADRTGRLAGSEDYLFNDNLSLFEHLKTGELPKTATVTVYKMVGGERCPFTSSCAWDQYFPGEKQGFMWKKMPHLMLGKCAEALALRKAFPADLSGLYIHEEMEQAGKAHTHPKKEQAPPPPPPPAPRTEPLVESNLSQEEKQRAAIYLGIQGLIERHKLPRFDNDGYDLWNAAVMAVSKKSVGWKQLEDGQVPSSTMNDIMKELEHKLPDMVQTYLNSLAKEVF